MLESRCMFLPLHRLTEGKDFIHSLKISLQQICIQKKTRLARPHNREEAYCALGMKPE